MKTLYLDTHSDRCLNTNKEIVWINPHQVCDMNPERFLFFLYGEYYFLTYHDCEFAHESDIDTKVFILKTILKNTKFKDCIDVYKSIKYDELKEYRLRNKNIKKYHTEVNYCYNNFSKQYYIVTERKFIDVLANDVEYDNAYKEAKQYLIEQGMESYIKQLDELYFMNRVIKEDDAEIFKTIEHLADTLNNHIKQKSIKDGNNKKSKLKRTAKALI